MTAFFSLPIVSLVALALCAAITPGFFAPASSSPHRASRRRPLWLGFISLAIPIALLGALLLVVRALLD